VKPLGESELTGHRAVAKVEKDEFRRVMGRFVTGVAIVTILDPDGRPYGFVVGSFTSVSLDPPEVLICIDRKVSGHRFFSRGKIFSVHVLRGNQESLCAQFLRKGIDRFEGLTVSRTPLGAPLIEGMLAVLECRIKEVLPAGDHDIFLSHVCWMQAWDGVPLLFYGGQLRSL